MKIIFVEYIKSAMNLETNVNAAKHWRHAYMHLEVCVVQETSVTAPRPASTITIQRPCMRVTFGLTQSFSLQPIVI